MLVGGKCVKSLFFVFSFQSQPANQINIFGPNYGNVGNSGGQQQSGGHNRQRDSIQGNQNNYEPKNDAGQSEKGIPASLDQGNMIVKVQIKSQH